MGDPGYLTAMLAVAFVKPTGDIAQCLLLTASCAVLKHLPRDITYQKVCAMVESAAVVRRELTAS